MSARRDIDRVIATWLTEVAPEEHVDYLDETLGALDRVGQRPAWASPGRWLPVQMTLPRVEVPRAALYLALLALLLLGTLMALAIAGGQRRVPPPFGPAANGLVAYSKDGDIYTVDPATGARRAIVTGATTDQNPAFSLDGTRLAFARSRGSGQVIVVADADGGNQFEIPMTPLADLSHPTWSPDGRWIAVVAHDSDTKALWMVDAVAGTARKTDGLVLDDEALYWRPPDGRQLAVIAQVTTGIKFALVSPAGDVLDYLWPLGYAGGQFRAGGWTPDGSRFAYASDPPWGQVHVVAVDGGGDIQVQPIISGNGAIYPLLSNDGRRVLFMEQGGSQVKAWLSVAPSDGSKPGIRVSDIYDEGIGTHYIWSPDDSTIEFEPNAGPKVILDPAGGASSTPSWITEGAESWQRLAPRS
jgi:hypothetical protein